MVCSRLGCFGVGRDVRDLFQVAAYRLRGFVDIRDGEVIWNVIQLMSEVFESGLSFARRSLT